MRLFTCTSCMTRWEHHGDRGPLPVTCAECQRAAGRRNVSTVVQVRVEHSDPFGITTPDAAAAAWTKPAAPTRTPFNSTPVTAPVEPPVPQPHIVGNRAYPTGPDQPLLTAGPLQRQITAELELLPAVSPMDATLRTVALQVAALADTTGDMRAKMSALKELRSIITDLTKSPKGADPEPALDAAPPDVGPFGPCKPEITGEIDLGECVPRWSTRRRLERPTWGPYFARVAEAMGRAGMPWQRHAWDLMGEVDHQGILCYRQIVLTVPRQSGKTTLCLAVVVGRAEAGQPFGGRQSMLYAAQTAKDATAKFNKEYLPDLKAADITKGSFTSRITSSVPTLTFHTNGSTFAPTTTGPTSGHGEVLDLGIVDEAFSQPDDGVEGAWRPAMITRRMAQLIIPSTAGDATSTYFKTKVDAGRAAAELDTGHGMAYIEYSADEKAPGFDPGDEKLWARVMPALGHTQSIDALRGEYQAMVLEGKLTTWLRAFLNIWVDRRSDPVFRAGKWDRCKRPDTERATRPVFAIDVSADRQHTSLTVGAMGKDGRPMVRLIEYRTGTDWVVDYVLKLREELDPAAIILDAVGPARSLIDDFKNNYVDLVVTAANDMAGACGALWDAVDNDQVSHFGEAALTLAVNGAEKRTLGDAWAWTRTKSAQETGTDISPLVAITLAYWGQVRFGDELDHDFEGSFG